MLLIRLICKRAFSGENWKDKTEQPLFWATDEYHLVHESLKAEPGVHDLDGVALTKIIFHCKDFYTVKRPTMSKIVHFLQCLHVFNGDFDVVEGFL